MRTGFQAALGFILVACLVTTSVAQDNGQANERRTDLIITAFASPERVRFAAPSSVVQIRLEVYNSSGRKLFDNEQRGANVLDWHLQDGQADRLADSTYLCVLTVKNLSGRITQRIGSLTIERNAAELREVEPSQMTAQQVEAIGPVEDNASLNILKADEQQTTTLIAHNGEEGQIVRGKGALSFRIGDFLRGKDTEQMRLTPEGNLGIGITHPLVKLDVDGFFRASQGIVFPDGTVQYSAASKTLGAPSSTWDAAPASKTPSQNNRAGRRMDGDVRPYTDGVFDVNASGGSYNINAQRVGIGTPNPLVRLHVGPGAAPPVTAGATLLLEEGAATSMVMKSTTGGEMFMYQDQNNGTFGTASTHPLGIRTNNINRIWVEAQGNVGIGTTSPQARLHVAGDAAIFDHPPGTIRITKTAGVLSADDLGLWNRSGGGGQPFAIAGWDTLNGIFINTTTGNVGINTGAALPRTQLEVRGNIRLGYSGEFIAAAGEENLRIVRGLVWGGGATGPPVSVRAGSGFLVSLINDGDYQITFNRCFSNLPAVVVTADQFPDARTATTQNITSCHFQVHIEGDAFRDFAFIAIGPP